MKNKCSSAILFVVVILPFTLFSYQNCSQLQSNEVENLASQINFRNTEPLLLSDLQKIKYRPEDLNCSPLNEDLVFYNSEYNLCATASDTCESNFLQEQNYSIASLENCRLAMEEGDMALNSFSSREPEELGYVADPESLCTQNISVMVNLFSRVCAYATDGCQAAYLRDNKFVVDNFNLCSYDN